MSKKPGGNERQEWKDEESGQEDRNHETGDKLESSKAKQGGYHPQLGEGHRAEWNNVKAASAIAWQFSTLCQQQMRVVTRTRWHRQYAIVVATKKVHPGGKNGKGRHCGAGQLVKVWRQWCHTST